MYRGPGREISGFPAAAAAAAVATAVMPSPYDRLIDNNLNNNQLMSVSDGRRILLYLGVSIDRVHEYNNSSSLLKDCWLAVRHSYLGS